MKNLLEMVNISKSFGGTQALDGVDFSVRKGEILALLGENGAGKSTLIKILAGVYSRDSGDIFYDGTPIESVHNMVGSEISFIHQDLGLIGWMTVSENIGLVLGYPKKHKIFVDWKKLETQAVEALDILGVHVSPRDRIMNLSRAEQSLVAISRALCKNASIIVLDEPTASLPLSDVEKLFDVLRNLQKKEISIVLVSHRLDEVFNVCDRACILRDGILVANKNIDEINEKSLVELILGKEKETLHTPVRKHFGNTILEVKNLHVKDCGPIDFTVSRGEVLALSGLRGAGQEEVARTLFGNLQKSEGSIFVDGENVNPKSPEEAIGVGISLLAKDRINESIGPNLTVSENMYLNPTNHGFSYMYSLKKEKYNTLGKINMYDIRPKLSDVQINSLSGGNQQKVVLARWLDIGTSILILEDPTQGIDIGARIEIYKYVEHIAEEGYAVILVSTDYEEVVSISHRVLVFSRGRIVKELSKTDITLNNLLYYASAYNNQEKT